MGNNHPASEGKDSECATIIEKVRRATKQQQSTKCQKVEVRVEGKNKREKRGERGRIEERKRRSVEGDEQERRTRKKER